MRASKLLIVLVALVFALTVVAACGSNQEKPQTTSDTPDEVQTEVAVDETQAEQDVVTPVVDGSGYVTVTYGDGNKSVYDNAFPLHSEYGYPGVSYVITSAVGSDTKMTVSQLAELEAAGWETASHSVNHEDFSTLSEDKIREEITASAAWLEDQGLMNNSFSYPRGVTGLEEVVKDTYDSAVVNGGSLNFAPVDPYRVVRVMFNKDTVDQVMNLVDTAAERNAWLVVYTHSVYGDMEEPDEISINASDLEKLFEKIQSNNMQVVTITEGVEIMSQVPEE